MKTNQVLAEEIEKLREAHHSREDIYLQLLKAGHSVAEVDQAWSDKKTTGKNSPDPQLRTVQITVLIGTLMIGAGIFSFVAGNWEAIADFSKVALLVTAFLAAYLSGWYVKETKGYARSGEALYFLGALIFGANVFLLSETFNLPLLWPDNYLLWLVGVLVMAVAVRSLALQMLAVLLGLVAMVSIPTSLGVILPDNWRLASLFFLVVATILTGLQGGFLRREMGEFGVKKETETAKTSV